MHEFFKNPQLAKALAFVFVLGAAPATHAFSADQPGAPFLGLFEGSLLIPDAPDEPIAMRFDASGGMALISKLEPTERESTGIGIWQRGGDKKIEFGFVEYRYGSNWICTGFDPSAPAGSCTLIATGEATFDAKDRNLSGQVTLTIKERSDGEPNYTVGPIDLKLEQRTLSDLKSTHSPQ